MNNIYLPLALLGRPLATASPSSLQRPGSSSEHAEDGYNESKGDDICNCLHLSKTGLGCLSLTKLARHSTAAMIV